MATSTISKIEIPTVPTFTVSEVSEDNISITANGSYEGAVNVSKSGYTPLGIVGVVISNASSSGSGFGNACLNRFYLSGNNANYRLRNIADGAIKVKAAVKVLYRST